MARRCMSQAVGFYPVLSEQGITYPESGGVSLRLRLPPTTREAHVQIMDGPSFPLSREDDGVFCGSFDPGSGFHYADVVADGEVILSPYLPIGFGASRPINTLDVPAPDDGFYQPSCGPHGAVTRHYFPSSVTGELESCLVYQPPRFDSQRAYPVLYLQHGLGENEAGWMHQGRANFILDRLILSGEAVPMLVVMCSGMVQLNGSYDYRIFPELLVRDVIPFIERTYRVSGDKWHRAMAGLSMGSMHTSMAVLSHPELFGYAGLFSGFMRHLWMEEQPHLAALDNPGQFARDYRVFFRAMGDADPFLPHFLADDALIEEKGVGATITRRMYSGGHGWQVWRQCLRDFLPMLFREE